MAKRKNQSGGEQTMETAPVAEATVESIKGFDADLSCRGYKFEIGQTYEVTGRIGACKNGFHACPTDEHPLSVFEYYPPISRFALVTQSGETDKQGNKLASAKITIDAEISLGDLTKRAIDWVFKLAKWSEGPVATGANEGATASGDQGAATASGWRGKVKGTAGNALFAVERADEFNIVSVACGIAGKDAPADVWLVCKAGKLVPAEG